MNCTVFGVFLSFATLLAAATLIAEAPPESAEAFAAARLVPGRGLTPGAVTGLDTAALLARLGPGA